MKILYRNHNRHQIIKWLIYVSFLLSAVLVKVPAARAAQAESPVFGQDQSELVGEVVQTGRSDNDDEVRGVLVFRVRAFVDDGNGDNRDGDGIRNVDMIVIDRSGGDDREVHRRRESNAGYCAFAGGEPNCNVYVFAENNNRWPNGDRIRDGDEYTLRAEVNADDGRQTAIERTVVVNLVDDGDSGDVIGEVVQTGQSDNDDEVRGALVFRVRGFVDDGDGDNRDGDGIRNVDMIIIDRRGGNDREVHRRRESNAGYCAFGGGEPNCNVYVFAQNNNRWPNGDRIRRNEEYILRAVVRADDGRQTVIDRTIVIR